MLSSVFLFLNIGTGEMVLIVFAALMLFGGEKLPELARGLGKGIRDFKDASEDVKREINNQINSYEDKKAEVKHQELIEAAPTYEPVAGTLPAFEGHTATDTIESELKNPEAPETYQQEVTTETVHIDNMADHPVVEPAHLPAADEDEPVKKTTEEQYK